MSLTRGGSRADADDELTLLMSAITVVALVSNPNLSARVSSTPPTVPAPSSFSGRSAGPALPPAQRRRQRRRGLYVDALNFGRSFLDGPVLSGRDLVEAERCVADFVAAAYATGIDDLVAFIDAGSVTAEAQNKWRSRREREVRMGERSVPHAWSTLLGDMFRRAGVDVYYSLEADNDDTLAAYADANDADVLSADQDFFRYEGHRYRVFRKFVVRRGRLILIPAEFNAARHMEIQRRALLLDPLPECMRVPETATAPFIPDLIRDHYYRRGTPSPLTRALGFNPHQRARPLRRALYQQLFVSGIVIHEEMPAWDPEAEDVVWLTAAVEGWPDHSAAGDSWYTYLHGDPFRAFECLFPLEARGGEPPVVGVAPSVWAQHCFACRTVVYEVCAAATGRELFSLLLDT